MAGFVYFCQGRVRVRRADLPAGLRPVFGHADPTSRQTGAGPDGKPGVTFWLAYENGRAIGYHGHIQTWAEVKGEDGYWLGYYNDARPGPESLLRPEVERVGGVPVKLRDGNEWLIPICTWPGGDTQLPRGPAIGEDGELTLAVVPEYHALQAAALRFFDEFKNTKQGDQITLPDVDLMDAAIEALAVNYRVGRREVIALDLLTTGEAFAIATEICGLATMQRHYEAEQKKTAQPVSTSTTGSGGTGSSDAGRPSSISPSTLASAADGA